MTEAEWVYCTNALLMLDHLRRQNASLRKPRLFGCARCCHFWYLFDERERRKAARSRHPGGVNALLGDGSVRFFADSIDPATWSALGTRAGGEVVAAD
jgi:prepilin-type processing-associated H-X9-DG protein